MAKSKRIVPDFMLDNPDDSFIFLMPLSLKPDQEEDIANSYFNVAVKNLTTKEYFEAQMAPEVFFTHYKLQTAYKNGKLDRQRNKKSPVYDQDIHLDTVLNGQEYDVSLESVLPQQLMGQLLDWTYQNFMDEVKRIRCYLTGERKRIIIPHYAIATYYYYRSTTLREATLKCDLGDLYYGYSCDPSDASIIVPKYVPEDDAPFLHRFLCQDSAAKAFDDIGAYIKNYMKVVKDKNPKAIINKMPIKAKFPAKDQFTISCRMSHLYDKKEKQHYFYIHQITDDDSPIGFSKFTTFFQGKKIVTDTNDIDNLPVVPVKNPSDTSERLKPEHASRQYRQNSITTTRKKKCSSLSGIEMSTDRITDEEVLEKLKIIEETLANEEVDQSLTDASGNGEKKTRKTRVSSKGKGLIQQGMTELTNNFDEFRQYLEYMHTQKEIVNLQEYGPEKMATVMDGKDGSPNPKCMLRGSERQYVAATFQYKNSYAGLLELENSGSTSTWVVSSKEAFGVEIFDRFLEHYVEDNMAVNDMKKMYGKESVVRFGTKNHERTSKLQTTHIIRWVAGVLGKV